MEWVETTGRTVAEALDAALDQLGVDEEETEYEVVEEPQKGFFGRLRVEARVRARVRPVRPRPKTERRDRRRRGERNDRERGGRGRGGSNGARQRSGRRQQTDRANGDGSRAAVKTGRATEASRSNSGTAVATRQTTQPGDGAEGADKKRRRRRGGRGRRGGEAKQQGATVENASSEVTGVGEAPLDVDKQRAAVEDFLRGLVEAFGRPDAVVSVEVDEESTVEANVRGDELGVMVGPKGQTLQAVNELVRSMLQRRFVGEAHARVRVDVAGYRERRRVALERFTRKLAEEVLTSGRAKQLDPMAASDRKVVHDVVNELDGVVTVSQGEEPGRRVIIRPA